MRRLCRNIYISDYESNQPLYYFKERGHIKASFKSFEEAVEKRKLYDFLKKEWKPYNELGYVEKDIPSSIMKEPHYNMYYAQLEYNNYEILVSDLYKWDDVQEVQRYLDKERWSLTALNYLKMVGVEGCREYAGILPLKEGYLIIDAEHNEYGLKQSLEEAVKLRNSLRRDGVII